MALPEREITTDGLPAVLEIVMLPDAGPAAVGRKVTLSVPVWPGARTSPVGKPDPLNPAPVSLTPRIVTGDEPELVSVRLMVVGSPTIPFVKTMLDDDGVNCALPLVTVRIAGLLVTVPEAFETATVNIAGVVTGGVV